MPKITETASVKLMDLLEYIQPGNRKYKYIKC